MEFLPEENPLSFIVGKDEDSKDIIPASTLVPELNQLHLYIVFSTGDHNVRNLQSNCSPAPMISTLGEDAQFHRVFGCFKCCLDLG